MSLYEREACQGKRLGSSRCRSRWADSVKESVRTVNAVLYEREECQDGRLGSSRCRSRCRCRWADSVKECVRTVHAGRLF